MKLRIRETSAGKRVKKENKKQKSIRKYSSTLCRDSQDRGTKNNPSTYQEAVHRENNLFTVKGTKMWKEGVSEVHDISKEINK